MSSDFVIQNIIWSFTFLLYWSYSPLLLHITTLYDPSTISIQPPQWYMMASLVCYISYWCYSHGYMVLNYIPCVICFKIDIRSIPRINYVNYIVTGNKLYTKMENSFIIANVIKTNQTYIWYKCLNMNVIFFQWCSNLIHFIWKVNMLGCVVLI